MPYLPLPLLIYLVPVAFLSVIGLERTAMPLRVLPQSERDAMHWISHSTPHDSNFVVLPRSGWAYDRASEWFPVLAQRVSRATVQGYEWRPHGAFFLQQEKFETLKALSNGHPVHLDKWAQRYDARFSHIYVPQDMAVLPDADGKELWASFEQKLRASPDYKIVFSNSGATIFARRGRRVLNKTSVQRT